MTKRAVVAILACALVSNAMAQESVTASLDECINSEKLSNTVKGAAMGAAVGLLGSLMTGHKKDSGKAALVGGFAGGALGYATAYYKAAGTCMQANPSWIPESNIQRSSSYQSVLKEFNYKSTKGDFVVVRPLVLPRTTPPGSSADVRAKFVVLTPDGGEAKVRIMRKLFASADNKEEEVPFFGKGDEERTVENGEYQDTFKLPISKDIPVGTKLRIEYVVLLRDGRPVSQTGVIEVN